MGGVLATMHMPYTVSELEPLLRFAGAKAVICAPADDKRNRPMEMDELRGRIDELDHVIIAEESVADGQFLCFGDLMASGSPAPFADPPSAGDAALLCFTSGTSSAPKAVMHASETLLANARAYTKTIECGPEDLSMIAPPFTHIFGLECVNNALATGGAVVALDRYTPRAFVDMVCNYRPTIVYGAPAHLAQCLSENLLDGRDLSSVKHVILGGAICPPNVAREFEARLPNGRVGILFGMTESLLVTQTEYAAGGDERHGSVGRPVPGIDIRIVSENGGEVAQSEEGELQLRGFSIMAGYVGNDAANEKSFTDDGWFRTGDTAKWDPAGNVVITGRNSDVINRGGIKFNPTDTESLISEHPGVAQVALVPMPDEILGERICAVVTLSSSASLCLEDVCAFLADRGVAKMRWPERLVVVEEMPMTPTKKIIKNRLTKMIADEFVQASR